MGKRSIKDLAAQIEKSYEMTRRYVNGWAIPDDPAVLDRIASALNTTVGNLVSGEQDNTKLPPLAQAGDICEPIKETTRVVLEDGAMTMTASNIRLFGIGDIVTAVPKRPLPGDVVLVLHNNASTLRTMAEDEQGLVFRPFVDDYATLRGAKVLGVVTTVEGKIKRAV